MKEKEDAELAAQRDLEIKRLAEIEEEEKRLREEEERLAKEEEEALRLAAEEERRAAQEKAPEAAAKSTGPGIEEALAECVVAQRAMEASPEQHAAINGLFNGLEMAPAAIEALTGAYPEVRRPATSTRADTTSVPTELFEGTHTSCRRGEGEGSGHGAPL